MSKRLTSEDWIAAGFRALAEDGPSAIKAEPLARRLGTSKGSFYWHFKDVAAFHAAMLALWEELAVRDIIDKLAPLPTAADRLRALAKVASSPAPDRFGGAKIEPALRAWSLQNPMIARGVAAVDRGRIVYLKELVTACGLPAFYGELIYAAFL
ncbi:MAG: TetR/AcrR family transcriptional regulator, partial [Pseudomonadota bacterium]